jgi:hypothetical protein
MPFIQPLGRLCVIMSIDQDRRSPRRIAPLSDDSWIPAGSNDLDEQKAGSFQAGEELDGALDALAIS